MNISIVHLKHTGTELVCDLLELNDENLAITIKDPQTIGIVSQNEAGAQMGFSPFLMSCKDNIIHLSLRDVLFIAEAEPQIAEQYESMFSTIAIPSKKIIV
jgi:hypothetical protein